jgi:hypothetical protein
MTSTYTADLEIFEKDGNSFSAINSQIIAVKRRLAIGFCTNKMSPFQIS